MNFFNTLVCGLLVAAVIWVAKNMNRKKLYAIVTVDEPCGDRCKASVILWNNSPFTRIYSSDYGNFGLCFTSNHETVISELKLSESLQLKGFNFSQEPHTASNTLKLIMGDLKERTVVEFEFYITKKSKTIENSVILLPHGIIIKDHFKEKPCINILCDRKSINLRVVEYIRKLQIMHWALLFLAITTPIITLLAVILLALSPKLFVHGVLFSITFLIFFLIDAAVPLFVTKHMKLSGKIKTKSKKLKKKTSRN